MTQLTGVSETLLLTLYIRHLETERADAIITDQQAAAIVDRLGTQCGKFAAPFFGTQVAIAVRTEILDREVRAFLRRAPDATVVNLGAGLCTRLSRVDDGAVQWIDVDLPDVEPTWQAVIGGSDRRAFLARSVLDHSWMDAIGDVDPERLLFVAEGMLMYLSPGEVESLLSAMARRFPGAELLAETVGPLQVRVSRFHPDVSKAGTRFLSGVKSLSDLDPHGQIRLLDRWFHLDAHRRRWRWMAWLRHVPLLKYEMKVEHLRLCGERASGESRG